MASSSINEVMEKTNQDLHQQPLKCPRCNSSNTKFCYYNNYSLSQPRHFCKACKRYWTRGGTLRSVPVGGGCRKNKRVKRPQAPSNGGDGISSAVSTATIKSSVQSGIDLSNSTSNHINNPLFYNLPTSSLEPNFPFSTFSSTRASSDSYGFDLQHQMKGFGLGFSSGLMESEIQNNEHRNGFNQIQEWVQPASGNNPITIGSSTFTNNSTMDSLQRFFTSGLKDIHQASTSFPGLMPCENMQIPGENGVKIEGENRFEWNQDQSEQINSSDSSTLLWNPTSVGAWFDPSNMGSSVPFLI